jgi:hypothetical protein
LSVNKSVAEVHENAIVSQYTYDDVIEAYVVSTDEFGNFSRASLFNIIAATTAAIGLVFLWMQRIPMSILDLEIKCT